MPQNDETGKQAPQPYLSAAQAQGEVAGLLRVLHLEAEIRQVASHRELAHHLANESRGVLGFRQAFVFGGHRKLRLEAVSSVTLFDRNSPLNRSVEHLVNQLANGASRGLQRLDLASPNTDETLRKQPFRYALWLPFEQENSRPSSGALLLREKPWEDEFLPLAERMRDAYAFASRALRAPARAANRGVARKLLWIMLPVCLAGLFVVQMPLTVLAPSEVTGQNRRAVAAPIDAAIQEILVSANTPVVKGDVLARLEDTELRNSLEIAERRTIVARATLEKLQSASFTDRGAARELKVAEAELRLAESQRDLARERLDQVEILAPQDGVAVFQDARELTGRPVVVGERIMDVIDPQSPEISIRLPVEDSIVLVNGARVRVFLDSDPLVPIEATLVRSSYHATTLEDGTFGYSLTGVPNDADLDLRIGAQGTAQVYGDRKPLAFILFRRPLSWLRQTFGF